MMAATLLRQAEPQLLPALARAFAAQAGHGAAAAARGGQRQVPPGRLAGGSIPGVQHIVAVASGKGGVGKSTTAGEERGRHGVAWRSGMAGHGQGMAGLHLWRACCSSAVATQHPLPPLLARAPCCEPLPANRLLQ